MSFATSLTYSLEEAAAVGGLKHPDLEEEVTTGEAGSEAQSHQLGNQEAEDTSKRDEELWFLKLLESACRRGF